MTLTVHHLEYSQSFRILWLLEDLGAPYEVKVYERDPKSRLAPAEYKAVSPLGTAPAITDGDLALAETNAIIDYILDQHPESTLRPAPTAQNRTNYLFWFHAAQGSMMPIMLFGAVFGSIEKSVPFFLKGLIRKITAQVKAGFLNPRMTALINKAEADLSASKWLAGDDLTAADIVMSYNMESSRNAGYITDAHPNCLRWLEQMHADPAFIAAMEKDGRETMVFTG